MARSVARDIADILQDNGVGVLARSFPGNLESAGEWNLQIGQTATTGLNLTSGTVGQAQVRLNEATYGSRDGGGVGKTIFLSEVGSVDSNPKWHLDELLLQIRIRADRMGYEGSIEKSQQIKDVLLGIDGSKVFVPGSEIIGITIVTDPTLLETDEEGRPDILMTFLVRREPHLEKWLDTKPLISNISSAVKVVVPNTFISRGTHAAMEAWIYSSVKNYRYRFEITEVLRESDTLNYFTVANSSTKRYPVPDSPDDEFIPGNDSELDSLRRALSQAEISVHPSARQEFPDQG